MSLRILALAMGASLVAAAEPDPPRAPGHGPIRAVRTREPIRIDGRLDERAWSDAPRFFALVQSFPNEGGTPTQRTEIRVLYDDANLYVGIICHDSEPARILRPMGRRDAAPYSDNVVVLVDAAHERRTAFAFSVSAAGVQGDGLYYEDDVYTKSWDAVWAGAASERADGWSAELAIPLGVLGVPADRGSWGFAVRREIGRSHEVASSALLPPLGRGVASRLGELVGIQGLGQRRQIQLAPYVAGRLVLRPQSDDASRPRPRVLDPIADVGLDLRSALSRGLVLDATVNPDFSQVEADEVIQNLTRFEASFPEKRPFFRQGLNLFQPVGSDGTVPQQLFYSRRIGITSPLLAAGKLSGSVAEGVQVGLLDAVTAGAGSSSASDRGYVFKPEQPLHFAPLDSYPARAPAPQNFFAAVARWRAAESRTYGVTLTSAAPLQGACTPDQAALPKAHRPTRCDLIFGNAGGLDWDVRSRSRDWRIVGQLTGSESRGGAPDRLIADGTHVRPGDLGYGGYLRMGKSGGEPWRFELHYDYASPKLDVNPSGFQKTQNEQQLGAVLKHLRTNGVGPFLNHTFYVEGATSWTTDGRALNRGNHVAVGVTAELRNFHSVGCDAGLEDPAFDVREITGSGIAYRRLADVFLQCTYSTDSARPLAFDVGAGGSRTGASGPLRAGWSANASAGATYHPHPRLEARLSLSVERDRFQARYVDRDASGSYLFADLDSGYLSTILRLQLVVTPRLTVQAYGQLFSQFGSYGPYYRGSSSGAAIHPRDLRAIAAADLGWVPSFHSATLNVNLVLRWEYGAGSTLFVIYARSQSELPSGGGSPSASLLPGALGPGPTTDSVMFKWTHSLSL
jgi:uncharacterized protein DUF5916